MFDSTTVLASLINLIGWRQNVDPNGWQLTGLLTSESGRFYNSVHPLVTIDNLAAIAPRFDQIEASDALRDAAFTQFVQEETEQAILQFLDTWLNQKVKVRSAANLLSDSRLFRQGGSMSVLSNQQISDWYGMEVKPMTSRHIAGTIKRIALQLDTNQTIDLELYSADSATRLQVSSAVYNSGGGVQWFDVNWDIEGGKTYYIGYHYSGKAGNAINGVQQFDFSSSGRRWYPTEKHYQATNFHVTTNDDQNLWDIRNNSYTTADNYGLNLELSFECDYTQFIIQNRQLLKSAIFYAVGIWFIRLMMANPDAKINGLESNVEHLKPWLQNEIVGHVDEKQDGSLIRKYKDALNSIQFDRGTIDETCLPCNQMVARMGTIGASQRHFFGNRHS